MYTLLNVTNELWFNFFNLFGSGLSGLGILMEIKHQEVSGMAKEIFINLRGLNCSVHIEKEFIDWYDNIHVPMILESGLIKKMRRFKKVSKEKNAPSLLMIYEFENQEIFARY